MIDDGTLSLILDRWLSSFILVLSRVLGFASIGPILSDPKIFVLLRISFCFVLSLLISPSLKAVPADYSQYNYFLSLTINLLVGVLIGFLCRLVLEIAQTAGTIMDSQLGISSASLLDPINGIPTPILSQFFRNFATVLFLCSGIMEATLITLQKSFIIFPLVSFDFLSLNISIKDIIDLTGGVIVLGIICSAPILVILLFVDIVFSFISRAAPRIRPSDLSFSLKPLFGILLIMFVLPLFKERLIKIMLKGVDLFPASL